MKKLLPLLAVLFFSLGTINANAQASGADYFAGKWSVLVKGLPQGDTKMIFLLEKKEATVSGVVQDTAGKEITKITGAELKENEVTLYFTAQGYDVSLFLKRKDDDHTTGSLMGMFDAEGDRVKATK